MQLKSFGFAEVWGVFWLKWEFGMCWRQWTSADRFSHRNAALHKHNDMSYKLIPGASWLSTSQSSSDFMLLLSVFFFVLLNKTKACFPNKQYYLWQTLLCLLTMWNKNKSRHFRNYFQLPWNIVNDAIGPSTCNSLKLFIEGYSEIYMQKLWQDG